MRTRAILFGWLLSIFAGAAAACPRCVDAIASGDGPAAAAVPLAFYYSILFMLAMPFLLAGGFGTYFYVLYRRAAGQSTVRAEPSTSAPAAPVEPELT